MIEINSIHLNFNKLFANSTICKELATSNNSFKGEQSSTKINIFFTTEEEGEEEREEAREEREEGRGGEEERAEEVEEEKEGEEGGEEGVGAGERKPRKRGS